MDLKQIAVQRFSVTSSKSFGDIAAAIDTAIGHPDMNLFRETLPRRGHTLNGKTSSARRPVAGIRLIMKKMAKHLPDAGFYAPVTILIDERPDGVHLPYDRMAGLLAPYESAEASFLARELDSKPC